MNQFDTLSDDLKDGLRAKEINVESISVQLGVERFPAISRTHHLDTTEEELPRVNAWRLNLAALSHVYNLFFAAYGEKLYVYQPTYPSQLLPEKPALILLSKPTPGAQPGYVDPDNPHSINSVFVDFLGDLEILLFACDDGDVFGYYTHKIEAAIKQKISSEEPATEVQEFFSHNVGLSAWGISVHSKSRKIAISANTFQITIFPFGLSEPPECSTDSTNSGKSDDIEPLSSTVLNRNDPRVRERDQKFILNRMNQNVPSIAFCNTDDDPDGKLIISGEILGNLYIWDLLDMKVTEIMHAGFCKYSKPLGRCVCPNHHSFPHAVWCLSWLDRRSFRRLPDYDPVGNFNVAAARGAWDGSRMRKYVPRSNPAYHMEPEGSGNISPTLSYDGNSQTTSVDGQALVDRMEHFELDEPRKEFRCVRVWVDASTPAHPQEDFTCPLFIASKEDALICQPWHEQDGIDPIVGYRNPLKQYIETGDNWIDDAGTGDRLSLQAHIPELGILIVGSPQGRVAVFSLNQTASWPEKQPVYFHRLDWLLPFGGQERNKKRPKSRLIGLAVGPVQGQLGKANPKEKVRKWRLFLHYKNHTIMSYQLSREDEPGVRWYRDRTKRQ